MKLRNIALIIFLTIIPLIALVFLDNNTVNNNNSTPNSKNNSDLITTILPINGSNPILSPDGNHILFLKRTNINEVVMFNLKTQSEKTIFKSNEIVSTKWLNNDTALISDLHHIFSVDINSLNSLQLTSTPTDSYLSALKKGTYLAWAIQPIPSPDKAKVLFHSYRKINTPAIYTTDYNGNESLIIKDGYCANWAQNGDCIIFERSIIDKVNGPPSYHVFIKSLLNNQEDNLGVGSMPRVSPNGQYTAFVNDKGKLTLLDLNTKKYKETSNKIVNIFDWSPDNQFLLLLSQVDSTPQLLLLNTLTLDFKVLVSNKNLDWAHWSPQGDAIIFESNKEIYMISLNK